MKALVLIALTLLIGSAACSKADQQPHPNDVMAADHARLDAKRAIDAPAGSMQRERAVLHIHATEEAILRASDTLAAATYVDTARALLRRANITD